MMYGLDSNTIKNIQQAIAKVKTIEKVVLYGSRAKGTYNTGSDIDIALFGQNLTLNNAVYPLMDELEELLLPYTFDISIFDRIDNLALKDHINRVGKVFFRRKTTSPSKTKDLV